MPPKPVPTRMKPVRLQTIQSLRIQRPNKQEQSPCQTAMSAVLNCWASAGHNIQGCHALEDQLRQCMDTAKYQKPKKSTINYHLMRMFPKISGPRKKD
ncbi:mitochondrial 37S ribosomal protein YmS-T [Coccidioides immitis RS]|uniref:Small ribosomal subunit protein mS37 n=7 Tax=Coccidioides TaxID=5500 RepID=J3KEM2_COCIM|nr:mitochondrial 37S ribosomal protein YmS-T [Coccidioides immitis RS]XP_003071376.1 mitochondrial 37S ribosomal protein YmS-T [Coccidioides posadasii C735 delta SOWgp]EFW14821.1 conserved hypothetical protein [Coccidioides posadasii str. Silveira]KMM70489.1 hypothetical protein CPAG_06800 [Coccidioides posadasii RMSCC 3488]KMP05157.1 hypothetical protein CIRG_04838 [Coccidioides immitis RMSCC 2394]KMU77679.1 hypothetical protein CISG_01436 [Coccidioides immitis RMSCC 3703]KMU85608.1 hypothet|eukprot:XP_003071376.1 mitochondrial 37S ribosomal protein YmS-T [Coccidioides posadasii C735 delta SOWgp]